jgi:hypothetical protein
MKKWALILFISCWTLIMVSFSGLYDSQRTARARRQYHDAPSETAGKELQDAKVSDRWHILVYELLLAGVLVWPVAALIRTEWRDHDGTA